MPCVMSNGRLLVDRMAHGAWPSVVGMMAFHGQAAFVHHEGWVRVTVEG